jgi:signal transduction histidine kinase
MTIGSRLNHRIVRLGVGRRLPRRTVRVRLTLLYGVLFLLSGAALVAVTYGLFERTTEYAKPQLPNIPHTPALAQLHLPSVGDALAPLAQTLPRLNQFRNVIDYDQHMLVTSVPRLTAAGQPLPQALYALKRDERQLARAQHQLAQGQRQLTQSVTRLAQAVHQVDRVGSVEAAQRASDSHALLINSAIALAIVAMLALLAGWLVAGRMLRPLRTITRKAQRISSASLHERLALDGPRDELKELGDTLDDLFGRLDAAFEAQRQFVANASHELRAPLTRQRALIQVALADPQASFSSLRHAHERVLASEHHLEQMIDGLLALTRGQAGLERREQLDLAAITSQMMFAREAQLTGLDLVVRATLTPAPTAGDPRLLERLIANLIDNAIRHNVPGGQVELTTGTTDTRAFVGVANTGPTVPDEEVQRLFEPFERLDGARTDHNGGHGLGLAIVQAIARAHDAEISARPRPEGGLAIEVSFAQAAGSGARTSEPRAQRVREPSQA